MPALPAVAKVVRVDAHYAQAGDTNIQTREFFQYSGTLSPGDAATWAALYVTNWDVFVNNIMATDITFVGAELTDLSSNTAPQAIAASGQAGGNAGAVLPAGIAVVVKKEVARRYRGGHPRIYVPGLLAANLSTPTLWLGAFLTAVKTRYDAAIAATLVTTTIPSVGTATHVNVSYFLGFTNHTFPSGRVKSIPSPRAVPLVDPIIATVVNPAPASQRRRNETP